MNKLSEKGIATATAILTGIWYILCFLIVIIFGNSSLKFFNLFFHGIELTSLATTINIINALIGLVVSVILAYVCGYVFAFIYNKYAR